MTKFVKDHRAHPANGPITEERLIRVRDELAVAAKRSDGGNLGYMMADAAKAIEELLAVRKAAQEQEQEQEQVYQVRHGDQWRDLNKAQYDDHVNLGADCLRILYAAPQLSQAPVLEWTNKQCLEFLSIAFRHAEIKGDLELDDIRLGVKMVNDSRAGAEPVSQPYTLRDGWVAVPVEPTEDMIIAGFEAELREEFRDPEAWEAFEAMSGCEQAALRAKWCLAAMITAAPQKEAE